jgi:hypothetical protein
VVLEKDGEDTWTDRVRNEEVLLRVGEGEVYLSTVQLKKDG